jgi:photosystem II stability/assembly factor-like uncharacterized protein
MKRFAYVTATVACAAAIAIGSQLAAVSGTTSAATRPLAADKGDAQGTQFVYKRLGTVVALHMITPTIGWAASNRGIFRTIDGGRLWRQVLRGNAALAGENGTAYFLNANTAWAILPDSRSHVNVFVTRDGGQHWSHSALAIQIQSIIALDFVDGSLGFILYEPNGAAGPMDPVGVWRTTNGGRTFSLIVPAPRQNSSHGLSQMWLKSGIEFQRDGTGWIPTNSWNNSLCLAVSHNEGRDWRSVTIRAVPPAFKPDLGGGQAPGDPVFWTADKGVLPVDFGSGTHGGFVLYTTSDAGTHWSYTRPVVSRGYAMYDVLSSTHIDVAIGNRLFATTTLGHTWRLISSHLPQSSKYDTASIDFVTPQVGFAQTRTALWRTNDGGVQWAQVT